jgi:hypothetical protein
VTGNSHSTSIVPTANTPFPTSLNAHQTREVVTDDAVVNAIARFLDRSVFDAADDDVSHKGLCDLRQSTLALLGDYVSADFERVEPMLPELVPALLEDLRRDPNNSVLAPLVINASWALGQVAVQAGERIEPWVNDVLDQMFVVLRRQPRSSSVHANVAVTIGRVAMSFPVEVAERVKQAHVFGRWCAYLSQSPVDEQVHVLTGLCGVVATDESVFGDTVMLRTFGHAVTSFDDVYDKHPDAVDIVSERLLAYVIAFTVWSRARACVCVCVCARVCVCVSERGSEEGKR